MSGASGWKAAPENTLESLRHGIEMFDGIEFDVRLTADNQLVVHHDRTVSIPLDELKGHPTWVEEWALDDLEALGFVSFRALLDVCAPGMARRRKNGVRRNQKAPPKSGHGWRIFWSRAAQPTHR